MAGPKKDGGDSGQRRSGESLEPPAHHGPPAAQRPDQSLTLHPTPCTLHPTPYTLHPTPDTLHPTPYTLHPTPYRIYQRLLKHTLCMERGHAADRTVSAAFFFRHLLVKKGACVAVRCLTATHAPRALFFLTIFRSLSQVLTVSPSSVCLTPRADCISFDTSRADCISFQLLTESPLGVCLTYLPFWQMLCIKFTPSVSELSLDPATAQARYTHPTLEATQGQILSQSPTNAPSGR